MEPTRCQECGRAIKPGDRTCPFGHEAPLGPWGDEVEWHAPPRDKEDDSEEAAILTKVTGTLQDGRAFWAYASIPASRYRAFKEAEAQGGYRLQDYGTVIVFGTTPEVPPDVMKRLREEFGIKEDFEADLIRQRLASPDLSHTERLRLTELLKARKG